MSLWTKPCTDGKAHGYNNVEQMLESIILSANVVAKHYKDIHFYTDKLGYEWIKPHLDDLPFTKIEVCLDDLNWVEDQYWSLVKMYVYKLQKEPFIHIDNDVYVWEPFPQELLNHDFIFQEIEWFNENSRTYYLDSLSLFEQAIPVGVEGFNAAYNCGVFGCTNNKSVELMEEYYSLGEQLVHNALNNEEIKEELKNNSHRSWLGTILIEQVIIYSIIKQKGIYSVGTILDDARFRDMKYSHTLAHYKRNRIIVNKVRERVILKDYNL